MNKVKLTQVQIELKRIWGWDEYYWYPLTETHRTDVLALECSKLEKLLPEKKFEHFIENYFIGKNIYEFPEFFEIDKPSMQEGAIGFGYWHSELCLAEINLKNLIYWSHEGTVTLGGKDLISSFKQYFCDWEKVKCNWNVS